MGVGFGRTTPGDPSRNVILQLQDAVTGAVRARVGARDPPGTPCHRSGSTGATTAGFQTLNLSPDPSGSGDWLASSLRGLLSSLPGDPGFGMECGPLLVDTGIAESLLWGPSDPTLGGTIPSGQTSVPNGVAVAYTAGAALAYSFVVGQAPGSPSYVGVRTASAFSINTGRALLVDDDYLFDAVGGTVGFRPAGPWSAPAIAVVLEHDRVVQPRGAAQVRQGAREPRRRVRHEPRHLCQRPHVEGPPRHEPRRRLEREAPALLHVVSELALACGERARGVAARRRDLPGQHVRAYDRQARAPADRRPRRVPCVADLRVTRPRDQVSIRSCVISSK